jgi:hypothetical protein
MSENRNNVLQKKRHENMNRGINKLSSNELPQKETKHNAVKAGLLVSSHNLHLINSISEAITAEKAIVARMLINLSIMFAERSEIKEIANSGDLKKYGSTGYRVDFRISDSMMNEVQKVMAYAEVSFTLALRALLYWGLANIGKYTFEDLLNRKADEKPTK